MRTLKLQNEFGIDVKRFYLPVKLTSKCTKCNSDVELDLSSQYLSYPNINQINEEYFYCNECDNEDKVSVKLNLSITTDDNVILKEEE